MFMTDTIAGEILSSEEVTEASFFNIKMVNTPDIFLVELIAYPNLWFTIKEFNIINDNAVKYSIHFQNEEDEIKVANDQVFIDLVNQLIGIMLQHASSYQEEEEEEESTA